MAAILPFVYRTAELLARTLRLAAAASVAIMVTTTMTEVLFRYFLSIPLPWATELVRTLFIWSVLLGVALATWTRAHIAVNLLGEISSAGTARLLRAIASLAVILLAVIMAVEGFGFAVINAANVSPALRMSLAVPTSGVAVGGVFIAVFAVLTLIEDTFESARTAGEAARRWRTTS